MDYTLDFERPIVELEAQIENLKKLTHIPEKEIQQEVDSLKLKISQIGQKLYDNLTCWDRVLISRHPQRPHALDYIEGFVKDFHELHGDRYFGDDPAVISGFGKIEGMKVAIIAIEKGFKTSEKIHRNFGMPRPEGYRKALRVMKLAESFQVPILCLIDTPGAYPGIDAEERGQAQAIALNLQEMVSLKTPTIGVVIGEGGSGGALGIGVADEVYMLEYSVYSVISPESCASILWSDPKKAKDAANSLLLNPAKALELKIIDKIIQEPLGGGHKDPKQLIADLKKSILEGFNRLQNVSLDQLLELRFNKYRSMGNIALASISKASPKKIRAGVENEK